MKRLKVKINFECTHADRKETERELERIVHYQIYEKIWNIHPKGVKIDVMEVEEYTTSSQILKLIQ